MPLAVAQREQLPSAWVGPLARHLASSWLAFHLIPRIPFILILYCLPSLAYLSSLPVVMVGRLSPFISTILSLLIFLLTLALSAPVCPQLQQLKSCLL